MTKYKVIQAPEKGAMHHLILSDKAVEVYDRGTLVAELPFYSYETADTAEGYYVIELDGVIKVITYNLVPIVVLERLVVTND